MLYKIISEKWSNKFRRNNSLYKREGDWLLYSPAQSFILNIYHDLISKCQSRVTNFYPGLNFSHDLQPSIMRLYIRIELIIYSEILNWDWIQVERPLLKF